MPDNENSAHTIPLYNNTVRFVSTRYRFPLFSTLFSSPLSLLLTFAESPGAETGSVRGVECFEIIRVPLRPEMPTEVSFVNKDRG